MQFVCKPAKWLIILKLVLIFLWSEMAAAQVGINQAEWYIDEDPGYGKGQPIAITNLPNLSFIYNRIDTLKAGLHIIGLRSKDNSGAWSQDEHWILFKPAAPAVSVGIAGVEWYIDVDPGYGKAQPVTLSGLPDLSFTFNRLDTLASGLHVISVRTRDANGSWGQDERWLFLKPDASAAVVAITSAEWYLDTDPGYGKAKPILLSELSITDDRLDTLSAGLHVIGMRSRDANGAWSQDERWLLLKPLASVARTNIIQAEYYVNADPGYSKGTVIPLTPAQDLNSLSFIYDMAGLSKGINIIGVRSKDANGVWSQDERYIFTVNGPLPVTGLELTATKNNQQILISWSTFTEANAKEFAVEKSTDGLNFSLVAVVAAKGNSTSKTNYSCTDGKPFNGINYYRIRQVDLDGKSIYSRTVNVLFESETNKLALYPNPVKDVLYVSFRTDSPRVLVNIFDAQGRWVKLDNIPGNATIQVNVQELAAGVYNIQVSDSKKIMHGRFIKR